MGTIYVETFYSESENTALFQSCPYIYIYMLSIKQSVVNKHGTF